ncbi:conserved domain-containing protein [Fictibacillus solisalsi]|uniref:Conserved domain-containing protein n=1 Tax=Fictibacillus solisalsi TaxID=459525 RepID=A0A1G9TVZ1_9BACL|nr:YsnF/AvaK domain-containing protein [Fictibacillus solisalsi]SDM51435.1 conserved domain-containing protein [Fictibacillus solisalsi]
MSKQVIGVYDSEEAVVTAVQQLQNKGYDTDDISVVTNHERNHDAIEMRTGAEVDNLAELNKQEETLFDKIKNAFTDDEPRRDNTNLGERLEDLGLPRSTASSYATDVEAGKILLVVDSDGEINDLNSDDPLNDAATGATTTGYGTSTATAGDFRDDLTDRPNDLGRDDYGNNLDVDRERPIDSRDNVNTDFDSSRDDELLRGNRTETNVGTGLDLDNDDTLGTRNDVDEERRMKLREEQLEINKKRETTGEVNVNKNVIEEHQSVDVPVEHEEVYVERRPVNDTDAVDAGPIGDNEEIRVPVTEERLEVNKKPVVTEEIVVGKKKVTENERVDETTRREEADIDDDGALRSRNDVAKAGGLATDDELSENERSLRADSDLADRDARLGADHDLTGDTTSRSGDGLTDVDDELRDRTRRTKRNSDDDGLF